MAQTALGARKSAAARQGISVDEYARRQAEGLKWCTQCKSWHALDAFGFDAHRSDGLTASCRASRHQATPRDRWRPNINPATGRPGPAALPSRDGDRAQARVAVNQDVKAGRIPRPDSLPCFDCGHVTGDGRRHEYDHHLGYGAEHHKAVQAVCSTCHHRRETDRGVAFVPPPRRPEACRHGHLFTPENTRTVPGGRACRECARARDRGRRDAAYWRAYRARRATSLTTPDDVR